MMKLLGANPGAGIVGSIYSITAPLIRPFTGIFPSPVDISRSGVFEWASLVAIIVYTLAVITIEHLTDRFTRPGDLR